MDEHVLPSKLLTHLSSAANTIRSREYIHVFSHYDADGVSAAGILACMLDRLGKEYQVTLMPVLNDDTFTLIEESPSECVLLTDLGASYISQLEKLHKMVIVLDHHNSGQDTSRFTYANPHLYGIDGMTSGCGSTMAFLLAVYMDDNNWDLVQIAFGGLAGDRQLVNGASGLNEYLMNGAIEKGFVKAVSGSLVPLGPLSKSLYLSTDPYIRGVSGNHAGVQKLLDDAGILNSKSYMDLTEDELWKLSSLISVKLTDQNVSVTTMRESARTKYYLTGLNMDAEYLADILNACGRGELGGMGVALCLGDNDALLKAMEINDETKNSVIEAIVELDSRGLKQLDHIQYFDSSSLGYTGILCGIAMQFIGSPDKPTIGINNKGEGFAKVSSRGTWSLLDKGIDLSVAMRDASESVGGSGGGHRIASGASFPHYKQEEFLRNLDAIIEDQKLSHAK